MAPKKGWKIFSHPRAWHLQLHGRKLVVRATLELLKVQASCKLVSQVSLQCRQEKRARNVFLAKKHHQHENVHHNFDHMVKRTYMMHACRNQKWKPMLLHPWGRYCIIRRCVRCWHRFLKLGDRRCVWRCVVFWRFQECKNENSK